MDHTSVDERPSVAGRLKSQFRRTLAPIARELRSFTPLRVEVVRESAGRPLAPMLETLRASRRRSLFHDPAVGPTRARAAELRLFLRGQTRETSFRHVVAVRDAERVCEGVSSPDIACAVLIHIVRSTRPRRVVELGSAFGIGTLALALTIDGTPGAELDGIEFEGWRAELADSGVSRLCDGRAHVHAGRIEDALPAILARSEPVDLAFIDAMHTYEATMGYHRLLETRLADGAILVYDDCNWSEGMTRCWRELAQLPRVTDSALIHGRWGVLRMRT